MNTENKKEKPLIRTPKFFWPLLWVSVVLFCLLDNMRIAIEKEHELEEMKREHTEEVLRLYGEFAKMKNEEERQMYEDSIKSVSAIHRTDSIPI